MLLKVLKTDSFILGLHATILVMMRYFLLFEQPHGTTTMLCQAFECYSLALHYYLLGESLYLGSDLRSFPLRDFELGIVDQLR